jgi:cyclopropane fatty-acyl-phospholipid synthase-like methyltransferase
MPDLKSLKEAIRLYYVRYYRDTLGLPDWEVRARFRETEENVEKIHMDRMCKNIGTLSGKRILNLGCGTGGFNFLAEKSGAACFGVDVSWESLHIA